MTANPVSWLRWLVTHEPALFVAACGVVAMLLVKLGLDVSGPELAAALTAILGVGVVTRQLVTPYPPKRFIGKPGGRSRPVIPDRLEPPEPLQ